MVDFLRGLGIGIVNVLGIAVPGALLLGLTAFGVLPIVVLALGVPIDSAWSRPTVWTIFGMFASLSYIAGYILRLNSPNDLDDASAARRARKYSYLLKFLLKSLPRSWAKGLLKFLKPPRRRDFPNEESRLELLKGERPVKNALLKWLKTIARKFLKVPLKSRMRFRPPKSSNPPRRDQYPYWGLKTYLERVLGGDDPCVKLVEWDRTATHRCDTTFVNMWKKDVELFCPALAAGIRSEEAHVRLMSGSWFAIRASRWPVVLGLVAVAGTIARGQDATPVTGFFNAYLVIALFVVLGMWWAKMRIEQLFHPRRVAELLSILHSKVHADRVERETRYRREMPLN